MTAKRDTFNAPKSFWVTHEVHQVLTDLLANWCSCPPTAAIHYCDLGLSDTICNSHFAPTFLLWYVNLTSLSKNIRPEDKQYFAQHALTESMQAFAASVGEVYEIDDGRHFEVAELALKGVGPDVFLHIKGVFIEQHAKGTASPLLQWTFLLLEAIQYMADHADRIKKSQVSHRPKLAAAWQAAAAQGHRSSGLNSRFERSQREADIIQANADKVQKASIAMRDQLRVVVRLYDAMRDDAKWLAQFAELKSKKGCLLCHRVSKQVKNSSYRREKEGLHSEEKDPWGVTAWLVHFDQAGC
ncbi:hypothetical protein WJX82_003244 [Trebouxia sp. C0006]